MHTAWNSTRALLLTLAICLPTAGLSFAAEAAPPVENSGGYRGPTRNGIYPGAGLLKKWPADGPKLLWKFDQLGPGWSSATVAGDTVYCLGGVPTGSLFAFDLETGNLKWKMPYGREFQSRFDGTRSTPTVSDGLVIFSSGKKDERSVYCLDAAKGEPVWHVDGNKEYGGAAQGWGYNESPLVLDDLVVFTLRATNQVAPPVVALDQRTGKLVWKADPGPGNLSAGDSSPAVAGEGGNRLVIVNLWRALYALDPKTGKTVWSIPTKTGSIITPAYNDGYLFYGKDGSGAMLKLSKDGKEYKELWAHAIDGISQAVILDKKLFAMGGVEQTVEETVTKGGKTSTRKVTKKVHSWVCYDAETGKLLKSQPALDQGSIVAADGMVYIVEGGERSWRKPRMSLLRPTEDGFEHVSTFAPVVGTRELWVSPTVAQGRLFIRHGDLLAAYDLRANQKEEATNKGGVE